MTEHFETRSKKGRGTAQRSLDLIEAMHAGAEAAQPITSRGIGYKLFTAGLIPSMARPEMQRVYRLLKEARERGDIPKPRQMPAGASSSPTTASWSSSSRQNGTATSPGSGIMIAPLPVLTAQGRRL